MYILVDCIYLRDIKCMTGTVTLFRTYYHLQRQEHEHAEDIKHVVNGSTSKRSPELVLVSRLTHGHNGVSDGCADICPHHYRYGRLHVKHCKTSQAYIYSGNDICMHIILLVHYGQ